MSGMSSHDPNDMQWFPPEPAPPMPVKGPKEDLILGTFVVALLLSVIVVGGLLAIFLSLAPSDVHREKWNRKEPDT